MSSLRIEHQCPQCGAPAELEETDRLFACPFCRVRSVLVTRDYHRYVLPARDPKARELAYLPYWRFKGVLLTLRPAGNDFKFVDVSQLAVDAPGVPHSLGLRSQAMKLKFAVSEMPGRFIAPARPAADALAALSGRFSRHLPPSVMWWTLLGESMGVLFAPFYAKDRLYDAVLDRPVGGAAAGVLDAGFKDARPDCRVTFVAAMCPSCGWDLEGARDALALVCRNCASTWGAAGERLERVDCFRGAESGEPTARWFPFWLIGGEVSGVDLGTYADLVRIANLPKVVRGPTADIPFRFWVPAFKLRAEAFLRLAELVTVNQPQDRLTPSPPPAPHQPVNFPVQEAGELLKAVLAGFFKPRHRLPEFLPGLSIRTTSFSLAYLPFVEDPHDFIEPQTRLAINKNQLRLSNNL